MKAIYQNTKNDIHKLEKYNIIFIFLYINYYDYILFQLYLKEYQRNSGIILSFL
jgi:hypothetical protein